MEKQKKKTPVVAQPQWEVKDRLYELKMDSYPPVYIIKSRGLFYFDKEKGYEREIKYARNQQTPFVDEMKGHSKLGHIIFRNGKLFVEKEKVALQKFLSLYHPGRGSIFKEFNADEIATTDLDIIELQLDAMNLAKTIDVDQAEAILRTEIGREVTKMTSKELKRDLLVFAQNQPQLFLELANDDNINVRNTGIRAVEAGIIELSQDQRTFKWQSTGKKLITVPFDENPYSALAAWFKTDDGIDVFKTVEKRLK
mgnify:FL=1|tara:strand:+ start:184 stop:945 length:762 start_codon:yes stop_codon:yes gene_type:complete